MKKTRLVLALLLIGAMIMSLGVCLCAYADDDDGGSITIKNALPGNTYTVYKVFDSTYSGTNVSYSLDTVNGTDDEKAQALGLVNAIKGDTGSPFSLTEGPTGIFWVQKTAAATATTIREWLDDKTDKLEYISDDTAEDDELEFTGIAPGFYLVTSTEGTTVGTVVTTTTASPDAEIIDKNVRSPKSVNKTTTEFSAEIGEEVPFVVSFYAVNFRVNDDMESDRIMKYVLTDTRTAFDYLGTASGSVFGDSSTTASVKLYKTKNDDGTFGDLVNETVAYSFDSTKDTLEITWGKEEAGVVTSLHSSNVWVVLEYKMRLNDDAYADAGNGKFKFIDAVNKVSVDMVLYNVADPENVGEKSVNVKTTGLSVTKQDAADSTALTGAEFILYKTEGTANKYWTWDSTEGEVIWVTDEDDAQVCAADNDEFTAEFKGLEEGTYYLLEVKTPDGYIPTSTPKTVVISHTGDDLTMTVADVAVTANANAIFDAVITNTAGKAMPGTGGIGTTVFYVLGGALLLVGAVLLITKIRMVKKG